jgi:hypothetical protein
MTAEHKATILRNGAAITIPKDQFTDGGRQTGASPHAQPQCGADDQAQGDEHVCGEEGDPGDVRRAAGLGWQPGEVGCHAQQERGGQPHDLMPRQVPHLGQARRQVRGGGAVVAGLAGAGRGHWYLPWSQAVSGASTATRAAETGSTRVICPVEWPVISPCSACTRWLTGLGWTKADRDELLAFACALLPRLRERTVDGSSLGTDAPVWNSAHEAQRRHKEG